MENIRKPQVAGLFYPAQKKVLQKEINSFFSPTSESKSKNITGLIAPHAGYIYSGKIAAQAYSQVYNHDIKRVIVISPSHYDYFEGCSVYPGSYETPLGTIAADNEFIEKLTKSTNQIFISEKGHGKEHALEVQLPFLQTVLQDFRLIPIVMGYQNFHSAEVLSNALFKVINEEPSKVLIVASSDLSHFYDQETANKLDAHIVESIKKFNPQKLNEDIVQKRCEACGFGPILSTMLTCQKMGAVKSKVMAYGTSGDCSKDYSRVVGYLSAIFSIN